VSVPDVLKLIAKNDFQLGVVKLGAHSSSPPSVG
jgi:hypothetical protein